MAPNSKHNTKNHWEVEKAQNASVGLNSKIKCYDCLKSLIQARYSQNSLDKYRAEIRKSGQVKARLPSCINCVGRNKEEMTCSQCDFVKGLDLFSRAQRRDPDNAKCLDCSQDIADRVPDVNDALKEEEIKEEMITGRPVYGSGLSSVQSTHSAHPGVNWNTSSAAVSGRAGNSAESDDGVWIQGEPDVGRGSFTPVSRPPRHTSNSGNRSRTDSVVSGSTYNTTTSTNTSGSTMTWGDYSPVERAYPAQAGGSRAASGTSTKFVKQGAPKQDAESKVQGQMQRVERQKREQEESRFQKQDSDNDEDDEWVL